MSSIKRMVLTSLVMAGMFFPSSRQLLCFADDQRTDAKPITGQTVDTLPSQDQEKIHEALIRLGQELGGINAEDLIFTIENGQIKIVGLKKKRMFMPSGEPPSTV